MQAKDGAEKLTEDQKKPVKPWTSEMESTTFYRGISIDAHLFLQLLATVEHENESSETLHTISTVFMKLWTL